MRCQTGVRCFVRWKATRHQKVADITDPLFWEEDTRPIPNEPDTDVHVVTQDNKYINWERCLNKIRLMGVVHEDPRRMGFALGYPVHFKLRTHTVLEHEGGYVAQEDIHEVIIVPEMLRHVALLRLRTGDKLVITASVYYRFYYSKNSLSGYILTQLFLESFDKLNRVSSRSSSSSSSSSSL